MQNNRRQFFIYDLEIGARKAGAVIPTMNDLLPAFQRLHAASRTHAIRSGSARLLLGDIQVDAAGQYVTMLARLSDKSAPNAVYSDPNAGHFNEFVKTPAEGSDFGCHVLISTAPEQGVPNVYTCAIERVSGLAPDLVRRLLSKFLNFEFHENLTAFTYPAPGGGLDQAGQPRMERCCPHVEMRGRPSDTLVNDINNGHLTGVTLIRAEPVTPIAGAAFLRKKASELKLDIDHAHLPAQLWNALTHAFSQNAATYGEAKVSYKIPGSSRVVTVDIDMNTGAPLQDMYVKSFELNNIFPFLAQSSPNIVPHLRDLALPHFLADRNI